ncbi:TPA: hypothetical protein ACTVAH_005153 [Citrobacter freundii]
MSRQEAATQLFMSAPPASIDVVIEQLERDAQAAGIDIHTISVMASLLRDRIEAYSDVLKIEPERVIHALEVLRGTEVPWAFYTPSRLPELEDVHCWETPHDFDQDLGEHQLRRYICPKCEHESTDPMRCTAGHAPGVNQYPESCDATIWNSPDSWDSINPIIKLIIKSTFQADLTVHTIFYPKGLKLPEIQDVE